MGLQFFYKKTSYGEDDLEQISEIQDYDEHDLQHVTRYERLNEGGWNMTDERRLVKFKESEWTALPTEQFAIYEFYPTDYSSVHDPYVPPEITPDYFPKGTVTPPGKWRYRYFPESEEIYVIPDYESSDDKYHFIMVYALIDYAWIAAHTRVIKERTPWELMTFEQLEQRDLDFHPYTTLEAFDDAQDRRKEEGIYSKPLSVNPFPFVPGKAFPFVPGKEPKKNPSTIAIVMGLAMGGYLALR